MVISEKDLLEAGFSKSEAGQFTLGRLAAGGTMQHLIDALTALLGFRMITVALVLVMLVTLIAGSRTFFPKAEFPCCPDHCPSGDLSTSSGLKAFRLQKTISEGSIVKSSATLAFNTPSRNLSAIADVAYRILS